MIYYPLISINDLLEWDLYEESFYYSFSKKNNQDIRIMKLQSNRYIVFDYFEDETFVFSNIDDVIRKLEEMI